MSLDHRKEVAEQVLEAQSDPWQYRLSTHVDYVNPCVTTGTRTLGQFQSVIVINVLLAFTLPM